MPFLFPIAAQIIPKANHTIIDVVQSIYFSRFVILLETSHNQDMKSKKPKTYSLEHLVAPLPEPGTLAAPALPLERMREPLLVSEALPKLRRLLEPSSRPGSIRLIK
jgi:hypothetical protein